jgi:hypothetical protein
MSVELQGYLEKTEELEKIYSKERKTGLHGFFKDIEIRRVEFFLLVLIFNCLGCIVSLTLDLTLFRLDAMIFSSFTAHSVGLAIGVLLGVIFAAIKIDRESRRFRLIQLCLFIATLNSILQINFLGPSEAGTVFTIISYGVTGFIVVVLFFMLMTLFLEYSSILERGRVLSFIFIEMMLTIIVVGVISQIGLVFFPTLMYINIVFNILTIYFIQKEKLFEKPALRKQIQTSEERHINTTVIKALIFIFFFTFTIGMASSLNELEAVALYLTQTQEITFDIILFFFMLITATMITSLIVGIVFDFYGRLVTISIIILIITISTFSDLIHLPIMFLDEIIVVSSYLAGIMAIVLIVGDITKRKNFGKVLTISLSIGIFGLALGFIIRYGIPIWLNNAAESSLIILSVQYLSSVITLTILVNAKETLPHKEKEWYESLIHFYIIHKTGVLLFDHEFTQQDDRIESDLVSGGIVGITALLQEIVKGKEKLRTIDHGEKKLMFKYSPKKDVIFVLVIVEDLIVLRNKLDQFILDFIENYDKKLEKLDGVIVAEWKGVVDLIDKYFKRKYFELILES